MSKRSQKMYSGSPRIVADADGRKIIAKGPKEAPKEEAGDKKNPKSSLEIKHKHQREKLELEQRQEIELLDTGATSEPAAT